MSVAVASHMLFHVDSHVRARIQRQVPLVSFSTVTVVLSARQLLSHRSGGSVDPFWPSVSRKTQAVVDAVMQASRGAVSRAIVIIYV